MGCVLELLRVLNYRPTLDGCALQLHNTSFCLLTLSNLYEMQWSYLIFFDKHICTPKCLKWHIPNPHCLSAHTKEKKECGGAYYFMDLMLDEWKSLSPSNGMISHCMCHDFQLTLDRQLYMVTKIRVVSFSQGGTIRVINRIPWDSVLKPPNIGIVLRWVTFLNLSSGSNWGYSNLPLKYASRLRAQFFLTRIRVHTLLFEHVMWSHFPQMHEFFYTWHTMSVC